MPVGVARRCHNASVRRPILHVVRAAARESELPAPAGDAAVASFNMNEKDIENFMKQEFIVTCSDGSDGHPRKYGTFPKLFHEYVHQKHVLTLERAVQQSSAEAAKILRLKDRGVLAPGAFADVVVFDPATFADRSTYEQSTVPAVGVRYLLVNGVLTVDGGTYTGATAGRALRRGR